MRNPVAVVSAIIAVIEIIHVGGTAVDREKGCRGTGTARVCGGGVGGIAAGAGAVPAEEVLGQGHRRSRGAIERGAQTKNLVDLVLHRGEQEAGVHACQCHVQSDTPGTCKGGCRTSTAERLFGGIDPKGSTIG